MRVAWWISTRHRCQCHGSGGAGPRSICLLASLSLGRRPHVSPRTPGTKKPRSQSRSRMGKRTGRSARHSEQSWIWSMDASWWRLPEQPRVFSSMEEFVDVAALVDLCPHLLHQQGGPPRPIREPCMSLLHRQELVAARIHRPSESEKGTLAHTHSTMRLAAGQGIFHVSCRSELSRVYWGSETEPAPFLALLN